MKRGVCAIVPRHQEGFRPKVIGMGILADDGEVVTCAHVVDAAIGDGWFDEPGEGVVRVCFPYADGTVCVNGTVDRKRYFRPEGAEESRLSDIAVVRLPEPPEGLDGLTWRSTECAIFKLHEVNAPVNVFGFRRKDLDTGDWESHPDGEVVESKVLGPLPGGRVYLEGTLSTGVEPGFSGAAVYDMRQEAVVGMVVQASAEAGRNNAQFIDACSLLQALGRGPRGLIESVLNGLMDYRITGSNFSRDLGKARGYLSMLADELSRSPWPRPRPGTGFFQDLYVPLRVGTHRLTPEYEQAPSLNAIGGSTHRAYSHQADESRFLNRHGESPPLPWWDDAVPEQSARERYPWAVVLGDPGLGKTTLLRYEGWLTAQQQIEGVLNGRFSVEDVILPVYVRLADLADRATEADMLEAVAGLATDPRNGGFAVTPAMANLLRTKLKTGQVVMLLDALDEVVPDRYGGLVRWLQGWVRLFPPRRIYLTSRLVGYRGQLVGQSERFAELELVAFTSEEVSRFVAGYFGDAPDKGTGLPLADELSRQLKLNPSVLGLTQTPLLLTLTCVAFFHGSAGDRLQLPASRTELYAECLGGLLGSWPDMRRELPPADLADNREFLPMRELLAAAAWRLSASDPQHASFTVAEARAALQDDPALIELGWTAEQALQRLGRDYGVFIRTGNGLDARYLFLHRTFQEYLLAWALGRREDWLEAAVAKACQPAWFEILGLLGGVLAQQDRERGQPEDMRPRHYSDALLRQNARDLFCRPMFLAARVTFDCQTLGGDYRSKLLDIIVALRANPPPFIAEWALPEGLQEVLNHAGAAACSALLKQRGRDNAEARQNVVIALGDLGRKGRETSSALIKLMQDDNDDKVRELAAWALGKVGGGDRQVVSALIDALRTGTAAVRSEAAIALGQTTVGDLEVVSNLLACLKHHSWWVRSHAADGLGGAAVGVREAIAPLLNALIDSNAFVRASAAEALGWCAVGDPDAEFYVLQATKDEDEWVRGSALNALSRLAPRRPETATVLIQALNDEMESVAQIARSILGRLGIDRPQEAIESGTRSDAATTYGVGCLESVLVAAMNEDEDKYVRRDSILALSHDEAGSQTAVAVWLKLLANALEVSEVRGAAAEALGYAHAAAEEVLARLVVVVNDRVEDAYVREKATASLANFLNRHPEAVQETPLLDLEQLVPTLLLRLNERDKKKWVGARSALQQIIANRLDAVMIIVEALCEVDVPEGERDGNNEAHALQDAAMMALGKFEKSLEYRLPSEATTMLLKGLKNQYEFVRQVSARALAKTAGLSREVIEDLLNALEDTSKWVREEAGQALRTAEEMGFFPPAITMPAQHQRIQEQLDVLCATPPSIPTTTSQAASRTP